MDDPINIHRTIDAVWRMESAKIIAALVRLVRDVGLAEDLAQDALMIALQQWPAAGIPNNPAAWLMSTAKHRAIDRIRREKMSERKYAEIARQLEIEQEIGVAESAHTDDNDLLHLMFIPVIPCFLPRRGLPSRCD